MFPHVAQSHRSSVFADIINDINNTVEMIYVIYKNDENKENIYSVHTL
jgi:hypothetical protein